jgi:plasmid maintenance system antidote protein VapI
MTTKKGGEMFTAGKMAEALGVSQGKVKKLIQEYEIEPDEIKRGCKYYGTAALKKLKAEV